MGDDTAPASASSDQDSALKWNKSYLVLIVFVLPYPEVWQGLLFLVFHSGITLAEPQETSKDKCPTWL